jgi:hypothetical protein
MTPVCPECRTRPYPYLSMQDKILAWLCLCGVTRHDVESKKR